MVVSDKRKGERESMHKKFSILATRKVESITKSQLNINGLGECIVFGHQSCNPRKKSLPNYKLET